MKQNQNLDNDITRIANKAVIDRFGIKLSDYKIIYDNNNSIWNKMVHKNKFSAPFEPNLIGHDYQVIVYIPQTTEAAETLWACVDKNTGEVLLLTMGGQY